MYTYCISTFLQDITLLCIMYNTEAMYVAIIILHAYASRVDVGIPVLMCWFNHMISFVKNIGIAGLIVCI